MERQHVLNLFAAAALTLAGCAAPSATAVLKPAPATDVAQKPSLKVVKQQASLDLEAAGTGAITMEFVLSQPGGYQLQATAADVAKIKVDLKTRGFLLMKTVAKAEVSRAQMLAGRAAVNFTGLKAGKYTVDVFASDAAGTQLGSTTVTATVTDGETTTVDAKLQVSGSTQIWAAGGTGLDLSILDG
jgi:hypothetical protein